MSTTLGHDLVSSILPQTKKPHFDMQIWVLLTHKILFKIHLPLHNGSFTYLSRYLLAILYKNYLKVMESLPTIKHQNIFVLYQSSRKEWWVSDLSVITKCNYTRLVISWTQLKWTWQSVILALIGVHLRTTTNQSLVWESSAKTKFLFILCFFQCLIYT